MTRRILITLFISLASSVCLLSQTLSVASFKPLTNDLTANIAGSQEKDQNGDIAALIKVVTSQTGFSFEGGMAGIVKTRQEVGEIWVYVPHGIKKFTIKHPQLGMVRDYYFPCAIEAARTYELVLTSGEIQTTIKQDIGVSYLAMTVSPKNAIVYIDGELMQNDGSGEFLKALSYGEHQYRAEASGCIPEAGIIQIGKEKTQLDVTLKSALASLTIASATHNTQIFINEQPMGLDNWTGELSAGTYIVEGRKDSHRSQKLSVTLAKQEKKQITIPALAPLHGTLNVSYKPLGAEVWIDDHRLGSSPNIFKDVLIGKHKLTIMKNGYATFSDSITLAEGEIKEISGSLPENKGKIPPAQSSWRKDYDKAIAGDAQAQFFLGALFYLPEGENHDSTAANYWIEKSAEQGYAAAQYMVGRCYYEGLGRDKNYTEAANWTLKAANQGDAEAQNAMGYYYEHGIGVAQDNDEALNWYYKAAQQNNEFAKNNIQSVNPFINAIPKAGTKAKEYYDIATKGDAESQYQLALRYEKVNDFDNKARWFRKAAEQNHAKAQNKLGYCYEKGQGVKFDEKEAAKWYRKSAEQGYAVAQFNLGTCYYYGTGVKKDYHEAVKWYRLAADQNYHRAQNNLGVCYEYGLGVEKDPTEATKWYKLAAKNGNKSAKENILKSIETSVAP